MDRNSYPFNNAPPKRKNHTNQKELFNINKFPVSGASQNLRALSLSLADKKFAESWYITHNSLYLLYRSFLSFCIYFYIRKHPSIMCLLLLTQ